MKLPILYICGSKKNPVRWVYPILSQSTPSIKKKTWYHADWFFTFIDEDALVISIPRHLISQWFLYTYCFYTYWEFLNWVIPKSPWVSILFQGHPWRLNDLGYPHDCGHGNRPWHCSCRTTLMIFTARWTHQKLFQKKKTTTFWHWFRHLHISKTSPCGIFLNTLEVAKPFPFHWHFLAIYPLVN